MERTKTSDQIRWRKDGGGSFRLGRRIIKPGEVFKATKEEIPAAFLNTVTPLDSLPEESVKAPVVSAPKTNEYTVVPALARKGKAKEGESEAVSLFNVVDKNGKKLNELPLDKETADKLVNDLSL